MHPLETLSARCAYDRATLEKYLEQRSLLALSNWLLRAYGEDAAPDEEHALIPGHAGYLMDVPPRRTKRRGLNYRQRLREKDLLDYIENAYANGAIREGVCVQALVQPPTPWEVASESASHPKSTPKPAAPPQGQTALALDPPKTPAGRAQPQPLTVAKEPVAAALCAPIPAPNTPRECAPWEDLSRQISQTQELLQSGLGEMRCVLDEAVKGIHQNRQALDGALSILGGVEKGQARTLAAVDSVQSALAVLAAPAPNTSPPPPAFPTDPGAVRDALVLLGGLSGGPEGEASVSRCFSLFDEADEFNAYSSSPTVSASMPGKHKRSQH